MHRMRRRSTMIAAMMLAAVTGLAAFALARPDEAPARPSLSAAVPSAVTAVPTPPAGDPVALTSGELLPTSEPTRLEIPRLRVDVPVIGLGLQTDGTMQVPDDAETVGWYTRAPTPGSLGPAVLAGHVDYQGAKGTFAGLTRLQDGDEVRVTRADGLTAVFTVTATTRYPKNKFPSEAVYGPIDHAGLRLITCGGDFDSRTGHYEDNIVVFAALNTATRQPSS
ncbi:sortase family protein [Actinoplanes lutulentus]|uniref:Sortase family protein n=2 Tax=Actinoplanes lutulentus TaxID=1287878 RepID=A0A327YWQ9_9ACTN|nr:sortase family protein [Actinoplanes lutulentus]